MRLDVARNLGWSRLVVAMGVAMAVLTAGATAASALDAKKARSTPVSKIPSVMRAPTEPLGALPVDPVAPPATADSRAADAPPSCINVRNIRQAIVQDDQSVLLKMSGRRMLLMALRTPCRGLAFDETFYYRPSPSGEICARLDVITARSGSRCLIDAFQIYVPDRKAGN